jgi:hypothetical protein
VRFWLTLGTFGGVLLATLGCENDVALHLLPLPPPAPSTSSTTKEPTPVCIDGDPCSGHARALYFRGAYDRVEIPSSSALDLPQDFALEAWVLVKSYAAGHGVLNRWIPGVGDIELTFGTPEPLPQLELPSLEAVPSHVLASWAFVRPDYWLTAVAPSLPVIDSWHHVAAVYGGGQYRLYVDGAVVSAFAATEPVANPESTLYLGATARHERTFDGSLGTLYWPPIDGFIADVRLSSGNRYPADFTPEAHLATDASTIALWHLDEGKGATATDSGPSQLDGAIFGATWSLAPIRASP